MTTTWLILARAVHFGACLLFFGIFAFDRLVAAAAFARHPIEAADYWKSRVKIISLILLPIIALSGMVWFALVATNMSGLPFRQAIQPAILGTVWQQTVFGTDWKWRLIFWLIAAVAVPLFFFKPLQSLYQPLIWIQWGCSGLLLGSLAWAGHGQEDSRWHLGADILHLLIAGLWPAGLLPLVLLLRRLRRSSETGRVHATVALIRRFSAMSLGSVAVLALTGWVNAWFLVGSFANLVEQPYGRWLLLKIALFAVAVAIGAVNLLRLKPRLQSAGSESPIMEATVVQLYINVRWELAFGTAIILIVAVLGILPPAVR